MSLRLVALQARIQNVVHARMDGSERGATAVEYGLMVALIAGVIIVAVTALGGKLNTLFTTISNTI